MKPLLRTIVDVVELPKLFTVNGKAKVEPPRDAAVRQFPLIAKHPPLKLKPTFDVDVARPMMFRPLSVVVPELASIENAEIDVVVAVP